MKFEERTSPGISNEFIIINEVIIVLPKHFCRKSAKFSSSMSSTGMCMRSFRCYRVLQELVVVVSTIVRDRSSQSVSVL